MTTDRRLAALMFTDLVGYSALSQKNEALALELLEEHRQLLRPLFESHHGTEIKTIGDAFLVEFASAVEAARCAIAIQKALTAHTSVVAPERRIQVRIGLHVGDVVFEEGDVLGDGVNIASRIEPLAQPGGICVSGTVADQVKNKIGHPMESLGEKQLKNIKEPLTVYRIVLPWEEGMVPSKQARPALRKPTISRLVKVGFVAVVLVAAVGWWLASRGTPSIKPGEITSIAVLPLDNLMGDPDQDYFVDGMHEAIISNLARIGALKVISRTSTLGYRNTGKRIPQIARELGVDAIVEGSVLRAGDRVRITVQLIHGASDEHLWANDYEGDLTDILSLQKTVARAIAGEIKIILKPEEKAYLASTRQVNPEAYEAYLMGRYYWNKRTEEAFQKGVEYFQLAIEKDPTYALAYAGIADCYNLLQVYAYLPPKEAFPKARTAAEKALEIDSSLAEAHTSLAWVRWSYDLDWSAGEKEFKRALELNPGYATGHHWYSIYLTAMGRHAESLAQIKRAQEVDPLSLMINTDLGTVLFYGRQDDLAIEQYHKTLEMDKDFVVIYWRLAMFYAHKEMYNEANAAVQNMKELLGGEDPLFLATLGYIYSLSGKRNEAKKVLDELSELSKHRYIPSMRIALIYMGLGQKDQTFKWLEKAYEERDFWMTLIKVAPFLNRLRSDPRFQILLKKMNLELN